MSSKVKVNTNRLGSDAESIKKSINSMKKSVANLKGDLKKLNSMWSGPACAAFGMSFTVEIVEMEANINNLNELYNYEKNAQNKYNQCESKVSDHVSKMRT